MAGPHDVRRPVQHGSARLTDIAQLGVQITDSPYVVVSMKIMTRMGRAAAEVLGADGEFVPCMHSVGAPLADGEQDVAWPCNPTEKYIVHFPESARSGRYGSGYGGNALLGKKCLALRIASTMARDDGWLAEHMLILGVTDPAGREDVSSRRRSRAPAARPTSPCSCRRRPSPTRAGRSPPSATTSPGSSPASDGKLYAINPEAGLLRRRPRHVVRDEPERRWSRSAPTRSSPTSRSPTTATCGGRAWTATRRPTRSTGRETTGPRSRTTKAAHPNSRFTAPRRRTRRSTRDWDDPRGVPIRRSCSAAGARARSRSSCRASTGRSASTWPRPWAPRPPPPPSASRAWCGAIRSPCSRSPATTWATTSTTGLSFGRNVRNPPRIFQVNWFRRDEDGKFVWPGFGENMRVLEWIVDRSRGRALAIESPLGWMPRYEDLNWNGLEDFSEEHFFACMAINRREWDAELLDVEELFMKLHNRLPNEMEMDPITHHQRPVALTRTTGR